jgi:hypothetical protein
MNDSASERDDAAPTTDEVADAPASPRRVLSPDLLWVESVTERLLGSSEPPTWERASIGEQVTGAVHPATADTEPVVAEPIPGTFEPAPEQPVAQVHQLPVRTLRAVTRPLSYAEVLADRPRIRLTEEPPPVPYFASTTDAVELQPEPGDLEPAVPTAPPAPRPTSRATRPAPGEDMPAGVLRAALRDALPDDTARRPSAVDAIFGDPSWQVAPDEPDVEPGTQTDEPLAPRAPSSPPPSSPPPSSPPPSSPPPSVPMPEVPTTPPSSPAGGRHRTPDAGEPGTDIAAIRMALRSGDADLAAAVLALVADRGRERERVRMVETYLDAVLAEGDEGLAGAARLRRLLGE